MVCYRQLEHERFKPLIREPRDPHPEGPDHETDDTPEKLVQTMGRTDPWGGVGRLHEGMNRSIAHTLLVFSIVTI